MNFSGGPGALPASVLRATRDVIEALPDTRLSVLGMSHRSIGGLRPSLYNAVTLEAVTALSEWLTAFRRRER